MDTQQWIAHLVAREDQRVSDNDILAPPSSKYNDFSNVIRGKWLAAPAEASMLAKFGLHLE